jgi:four helix bundle protein
MINTTPRPKKPRRFSCAEEVYSHQFSVISKTRGTSVQDFHSLVVWQKAHAWVLNIYRLSKRFPDDERFGLTSQLRRAAASVPANLAEACGRGGRNEFGRFVQIAMGSASEAEYHVLLAKDLGYLERRDYESVGPAIVEIKRMLAGLLKTARGPQLPHSTSDN